MSDLIAAQADRLAAIEAAPDAPESLRERVAEAMCNTEASYLGVTWAELMEGEPTPYSDIATAYRRMADAALRVITEDARP